MTSTEKSKFLAYVLRHNPSHLGIELDSGGWTDVNTLLEKIEKTTKKTISLEDLYDIVSADKKGRYSIKDGRIRANQGHSIEDVMAVDLTPRTPPNVLYHGTNDKAGDAIQKSGGLSKMKRHHVHLTDNISIAETVAKRWKGLRSVILVIDAKKMSEDNFLFFVSDNNVWLTDHVPANYIYLLP
jgi:putative RNA 2'-phosphotransferase